MDIAATLSTLSHALLHSGDIDGARTREVEALQIFTELGDGLGQAIGHQHLAACALHGGDVERALAEVGQALALAQAMGQREIEAECELMIGDADFAAARLDPARLRYERSLQISRDSADRRGEATALRGLGQVDLALGDLPSAATHLGQALRAFQEFEMREELLACFEDHARLALQRAQPELAAALGAAVEKWRVRLALDRLPIAAQAWAAWQRMLRATLSDEQFDRACEEGRRWEIAEALRKAAAATS